MPLWEQAFTCSCEQDLNTGVRYCCAYREIVQLYPPCLWSEVASNLLTVTRSFLTSPVTEDVHGIFRWANGGGFWVLPQPKILPEQPSLAPQNNSETALGLLNYQRDRRRLLSQENRAPAVLLRTIKAGFSSFRRRYVLVTEEGEKLASLTSNFSKTRFTLRAMERGNPVLAVITFTQHLHQATRCIDVRLSPQKVYRNAQPVWRADMDSYVLKFHQDRVRSSCERNCLFQGENEEFHLQLGRADLWDPQLYVLDVGKGLTPLLAMALAVTSCLTTV